ncbi:TIR domain-containing protein [Rhizobium phage RHph_X2_26]|nr:TIR domain-containing protein [Rhizobium phage RHph_X2_26]
MQTLSDAAVIASTFGEVSHYFPTPERTTLEEKAKAMPNTYGRTFEGAAALAELPGFTYVATPYSKWFKTFGLEKAARCAAELTGELISSGLRCYSPIAHCHFVAMSNYLDPLDWKLWMAQCAPMMEAANGAVILMLPGWQESSGVTAEIEYFTKARKPILFVKPSSLIADYERLRGLEG